MKRIMVFLMFLILLSGMTYSKTKTVYLVVPDAAIGTANLKYYVIDSSGTLVTDITKTEVKTDNYEGDTALNLVKLEITTDKNILKMVAGYIGSDGKYYLLVSPDANTSNVETKLSNNGSNSPFDVFNGVSATNNTKFDKYSNYPGIKITDDVRLSLIPVTGTVTNKTEFTAGTKMEDISGTLDINPSDSLDNIFVMINDSSIYYYLKKNSSLTEEQLKDLGFTDDEIKLPYTEVSTSSTNYSNVSYLHFRIQVNKDNTLTIGNETTSGNNIKAETKILQGEDMNITVYNSKKNGNGSWVVVINSGKVESGGNTIALLEDTGVAAESGIAVGSKVKGKSRARDTNIKTSLIDSDNFVIENIKE